MWFGNIMSLTHDAFEDFIVNCGFSWQEWFESKEYLIPIRHASIDFLTPFIPGQVYKITAGIESFSNSSFKLNFVYSQNERVHAQVKMVHTFLDAKSKKKVNIPSALKTKLEAQMWNPI